MVKTCIFCGKVCGGGSTLEEHVVAEHGLKRNNYRCRYKGCSAAFNNEPQLLSHQTGHRVGASNAE